MHLFCHPPGDVDLISHCREIDIQYSRSPTFARPRYLPLGFPLAIPLPLATPRPTAAPPRPTPDPTPPLAPLVPAKEFPPLPPCPLGGRPPPCIGAASLNFVVGNLDAGVLVTKEVSFVIKVSSPGSGFACGRAGDWEVERLVKEEERS